MWPAVTFESLQVRLIRDPGPRPCNGQAFSIWHGVLDEVWNFGDSAWDEPCWDLSRRGFRRKEALLATGLQRPAWLGDPVSAGSTKPRIDEGSDSGMAETIAVMSIATNSIKDARRSVKFAKTTWRSGTYPHLLCMPRANGSYAVRVLRTSTSVISVVRMQTSRRDDGLQQG